MGIVSSDRRDCQACRWSVVNLGSAASAQAANDVGLACRRHPPAVSFVPAPVGSGQVAMLPATAFPMVKPEWWCGEFSWLKTEQI